MNIGIDRVVVLRGYPPETDRLPHQPGNALGLHLLHDLGAIALHRSHADVKLGRDGMAGESLHYQIENFDLARRQPGKSRRRARLAIYANSVVRSCGRARD